MDMYYKENKIYNTNPIYYYQPFMLLISPPYFRFNFSIVQLF